ncbi:MAG: cobalamin-dependent protein [Desulfuromonadales bacterium]|nr:cobalamin-dependent protein [Desulfuromonadales bacterium]MBN2793043.1 cobalamin-dependent protein [Desulfuromonadales bacterium]
MSLAQLVSDAKKLPQLTSRHVLQYRGVQAELIAYVDRQLSGRQDISTLIGNNPLEVMFDNHKHHAAFMSTVFSLGEYGLLAKTLPWIYRSYGFRGFSFDYFPVELNAWSEGISRFLPPESAGKILPIYHWMLSVHPQVISLSQQDQLEPPPMHENWLEEKNRFLENLLRGEHKDCLSQVRCYVNTAQDLENFYLYILQPAMFDIGALWEKAQITIAQEHLASSIVNRIMAQVVVDLNCPDPSKGKVVVSTSPNEFHHLGAWMLADILEHDGWEVSFIGADTPEEDLMAFVEEVQPSLLALSVTIPFNLGKVQTLIERLKARENTAAIKVMVGGRAFIDNPQLWQTIGADGYAVNVTEARDLANKWRQAL